MARDLAGNMRATTEALIMAFDLPWSEGALEAALAPRAPECEHVMLPSSLKIPKKTNDEWAAYFEHVKGLVTEAKVSALIGSPVRPHADQRLTDDHT